ncbi:MAG: MogA/MoaB family molybdenum cofactor biosynthesis protein [Beutenbergiaceae bacterium]
MSRIRVAVITVSDRCAAGEAQDRSGPHAVELLTAAGYAVQTRIVPDGVTSVQQAIGAEIADGARIVFTTGGTGIAPRDHTPEALAGLLERTIPGITEEIRRVGARETGAALLSRAVAGTVGSTFILAMPGSPAAVASSLQVVLPLLDHILAQLQGADHG